MLPPARLPRPLRIAAYIAALAVLAWLSLAPRAELPNPGLSDKSEHAIAYAILAASGFLLFPRHPRMGIATPLAFGVLIEVLQATMGFGRSGDWRDAVANTTGVAIACAGYLIWRRWRAHRAA